MTRLSPLLVLIALAACASPVRQVPDAAALGETQADAYREAAAALDAGEPERALDAIGPAAAVEPWHVPSHVLREDAMTALGRGAEAQAWYAAEAARSGGDASRVLLAARAGPRADAAREAGYRAALRLDPKSVWARIALAYELARGAKDETQRATTLADGGFTGPAAEAMDRSTTLGKEAEQFAESVVADRPDLAAAHGALADVLLSARRGGRGRRLAEALRAAEAAARLDPGTATVWTRLARARRESSDDAGAADALQRALAIAPRDARAHANLGRLLLDLRRDEEARAELETAAGLDPSDELAALNLGVALFRTRDFAGAAAQFERAARIDAADPRPYEGLALSLAQTDDRAGAAAAMELYLAAGGDDRDAARRFIDDMRAVSTPRP